ncbi:hypothetical protein [Fulvivirga sediminis]|uniref:Outer membrane protein beta-barrel domain-containing protein n=1 Tax=Fulvivirga sediminis TaxID=2803949 RepID=A0A937F4U3_9BACT|nr:hypothetical protein [Fulvivirga sediminis]MBL3656417.1 hypothetical protein [Fulvivirga sediminis]
MRLIIILFITLILTVSASWAQELKTPWIHTGLSMSAYSGELSRYDQYGAMFHIGLLLNKNNKFNGNFNLGIGSVRGENRQFRQFDNLDAIPNRYFKTNYLFLNYDLHYNIIKKEKLIVYISQGIGLFRFTPKDEAGNELLDQTNTRNSDETYNQLTLRLPTSVGAIYFLPNDWGVGLQTGLLNTMTNYIDNISELGEGGNDNILEFRLAFYVPFNSSQKARDSQDL